MSILFTLHSWLRWLIIVVAVIAVVRFVLGLARREAFDKMSNGLMAGYSGLLDLQALLGIIFLLWSGLAGAGFPMFRIEHTVTMIVAVVVAHVSTRWKKSPDAVRYRASLIALVASLVIVFLGIVTLPGGAARLAIFRGL